MKENKKYIRRSFWVHQYEQEEQFLRDMRAKGWKFVKLYKGIPTKYEFEQCEPAAYSYQLDYVTPEEDTPNYHQLFQDAGWEEIMPWDGINGKWYYFAKKMEGEIEEKIFTDHESKLQLVNKLIKTYGVFFFVFILLEINAFGRTTQLLTEKSLWLLLDIPLTILMGIAVIWYIYLEFAMFQMKKKIQEKIKTQL